MKITGIIPARYKSSRFPGKPLADICGKPMVWWVYSQSKKVKEFDAIYVATDSEQIRVACDDLCIPVIMTSEEHVDCIDRAGEVARKIQSDIYVLIQGDEPMIEPETIRSAIAPFYQNNSISVTNCMTKIRNPVDLINPTVPKVLTNKEGVGVFLSRAATPFPKGRIDIDFYKQVCVYGFRPEALEFFCSKERGKIEEIEDIGILRYIENGYKVQFIEVESDTIAVDTPNDLQIVKGIMQKYTDIN